MSEQELREQYPNFAALTDYLNTKRRPRKILKLKQLVTVLALTKEVEGK